MKIYIPILAIAILFSGCLKSNVKFDYSGIKPVIINPKSNFPARGAFAPPILDSAFGVKTIRIYARYSYQAPPDKDIAVTFAANDSLIAAYNQSQPINYKALPADAYSLIENKIIIKAGTTEGFVPITIIPERFNGIDNYAIAFTIKDGAGTVVADNYKSIVFTLKGH
ncbi:DUF1735 domain-containing protein [Mucilaginibacter sp. cycad4]|uniref:DUF1735 domain-containing protein n=1 Tax=Mucilaginibacter sp. cycad4 TaxID=3342096 RepID=UPI002AAC13E4|nr:DUF1735 domain-containing protein [Mucilaginibacter gossypii]WPU99052.1 DUF1735 domain-containing protein [Mucilaginibacter gossypii]